ncbi:MAG: extracellular solute-binding protein [Ruminococcaceae bacterium]|nr:extracellular solute-binding protein [Oscillospiraceae bacterium]
MKHIIKRGIVLVCIIALILTTAACSGTSTSKGDGDLTYWVPLNPNAAMTVSNYGDTPFAKELQERTGIKIDYQHPPQGSEDEKFNLMVMGELPDIIEYNWGDAYPGGPAKAIEDNVIIELDIENKAPNLYAYLQEHPEVDKMIKTDDGKYYAFPFIRGERSLQTSAGIIIRKDWLDDLGLEVPETIEEWEVVLKAFKEEKGAKYPLCYRTYVEGWGAFSGAYGVVDTLYVDNGEVKYGALEDGYKDFLTTMNSWYKKGYMPSDFATMDSSLIDSYMINGQSGVFIGSVGSGLGRIMAAAEEEGYELVAAPYPTLVKGQKPEFGQMDHLVPGTVVAISRDCKDVDLAMKLLDYGYSEEGRMFFNFGIEGESYNMIDGYPTYTEEITANAEGLSMSAAMARYIQAYSAGPFVQDARYMEQYASLPQQKDAVQIWSNTNMEEHLLPKIFLRPEESDKMAKKISSVNSYKDEMLIKFITGAESIGKYDAFVKGLKERGIDEYLKLMNEAYDRYSAR